MRFLNFWLHYWNLDQIQNFEKKMTLRGYVFAQLEIKKNVVR